MSPFLIEQSREQLERAIRFYSDASIAVIRLAQLEARCIPVGDVSAEMLNVRVDARPASVRVEQSAVFLSTSLQYEAKQPQDDKTLYLLTCEFEVQYSIKGTPNHEDVEAFQKANAIFNCWPHFRELVQNTAVRMGLNAPSVPFLRIIPAAAASPPPQTSSASAETPRKKRPKAKSLRKPIAE